MTQPLAPPSESGWYVVEWKQPYGYGEATIIDVCYFHAEHRDFNYQPAFQTLTGMNFTFDDRTIRYAPIDPAAYLDAAGREGAG